MREGDVAGFEIPARYFRYVHAGDARPLAAVLEHNRLDLLSLALVTARAAQLLEDGPAAARTAREALGMGRLYERGGMMAEAKSCFARAIEFEDADEDLRAEALRAYAIVARRLRQYDDAADAWRRVLGLAGVRGRSSAKRQRRWPFTTNIAVAIWRRRVTSRCVCWMWMRV